MPANNRALAALIVSSALIVSACGSSGRGKASTPRSSAGAIEAKLKHAGWQAQMVVGMPHTLTGLPQLFDLQTVAPDGARINLQFFSSPAHAAAEDAAAVKRLRISNATSIGDAFVRGDGAAALTGVDVTRLRRLLATG